VKLTFKAAMNEAGLKSAGGLAWTVITAFMAIMLLNAVRVLIKPEEPNKLRTLLYKVFIPLVVIKALSMVVLEAVT
jgi:hypothetical protein